MIGAMTCAWLRKTIATGLAAVASCLIVSCGSSPHEGADSQPTSTFVPIATSSTTTLPPTTTTTTSGIAVPDVVGMQVNAARFFLHIAGFFPVAMNTPCQKSSADSQSIAQSLSIPGPLPHVNVGATPLSPGTLRPKGSFVGITWSRCFPNGTYVPKVTGLTFGAAVTAVHAAGLTWSCFSTGTTTSTVRSTTTSSVAPPSTSLTTTTDSSASGSDHLSIGHVVATTTTTPAQTVLSQSPSPGLKVGAGTPVTITMHGCPQ